jgi:DNA-binding XRE family transcriptional regulator
MAGHRKFSTLRERMKPAQRDRADARVKELQTEMLLSELRKFSGKTQQEVAEALGITQPGLSKMEKQSDMQITTLDRIIQSLGGQLEIVAHMPNADVVLTQFVKHPA